jgi:hypothetical protein
VDRVPGRAAEDRLVLRFRAVVHRRAARPAAVITFRAALGRIRSAAGWVGSRLARVGPLSGFRRRRVLSALGAVASVAMMVGIIVGGGLPDSSNGASATSPPAAAGSGSGVVERRDLISTDTESGTLGYADPRTVFNRMSGTITWLPSAGSEVKPGQQLYQVDGAPVILFDGTVPAYRTLTSGMSDGPDVAELKQNLVNLGFDPGHAITVNNTFDSATTDAINRWQASLGQTQTGTVTLGQVVFLPGTRRISSVTGVLGSTGASGSSGSSGSTGSSGSATGASLRVGEPQPQFVSYTPSESGSQTASAACTNVSNADAATIAAMISRCQRNNNPTAKQLLAELVAELKKLVAQSSRGSGTSGTSGASGRSGGSAGGGASSAASTGSASRSGGGASSAGASSAGGASGAGGASSSSAGGSGAATAIMQTTSSELAVTVNLDATKQSEATLGEPVSVQLSDGTNDGGKITTVSSVAQSSSSSSSSGATTGGAAASGTPTATVPVTITLTGKRHVAGLDQSAVSVNFQQQVRKQVLAVPVTALLATAGGGYAVQTVGRNGQRQTVLVTPGLFAGGYVEVSGSALTEGMRVSDSQG